MGTYRADCLPRSNLSIIEPFALAKISQPNLFIVHRMELGQRPRRSLPHLGPLFRRYARHARILDDPAIQELHNVERRPYDRVIFAQTERLWYGNGGWAQGGDDAVLALDFVGGFGEQFAGRLLSQYIAGRV